MDPGFSSIYLLGSNAEDEGHTLDFLLYLLLGLKYRGMRTQPGFSSIYPLGFQYGGRGADPGFSYLYIVGVKYSGRGQTLDFPLYNCWG